MLFYDGSRWKPFPYEITYIEHVKVFDTEVSRYKDKENMRAKAIELSEAQRRRLEIVSKVTTLSLDSLIRYVMDDEMKEKPSKELTDAIAKYEERQVLKGLVDAYNAPVGQLMKMGNLILTYEVGAYYESDDIVECNGTLYVVQKSHVASVIHPNMDESIYLERN